MAITAGLYELRSMMLTSMAVTGSGYTPVKGSNVFLYAWNDGGNRKWRLTQNSAGRWRLQNASNTLYMTLASNTPANGVNVRQWTASSNGIQWWNVIETGETANFEGYTCPVVRLGNYATSDGATWMLDVDKAMTTNNANMEVNRSNSNDSQKFLLVPSTLLNNSYPVPASLGWTADTSGNPYGTVAGANRTMYAGWRLPSTWVPDETRGYERRVRTRLMDGETSTWGAWGEWSQWADVDPYVRGEWCYDLNSIDASFDQSAYKARDVDVQVRCKTSTTHGNAASRTVRAIADPTIALAVTGADEGGFAVTVTTDYVPAHVTITSLDFGGEELLATPVKLEMLGPTATLTLPWESLGTLPEGDETVTATYTRGTDLFATFGGTKTATLALDYGTPPATAPTVTASDGLTLAVSHAAGIAGAWTSDGRGVYPSEDGTHVVYPFGKPFDLLVALGDGKLWHASMPAQSAAPCHAWNWDGGHLLLEHVTGRMVTSRTIKAVADTMELDARPWQTVTFSDTLDGSLKAAGVLWAGSECTTDDVVALMRAHNATYRAPSGEVMHVAVTDVSYETDSNLTEVDVSMVQVTR